MSGAVGVKTCHALAASVSASVRCMCQGQEHVLESVHGHVTRRISPHCLSRYCRSCKNTFDCTAQLRERTCSATGCETWLCHPHSGGRGLLRSSPDLALFFFFAEVRLTSWKDKLQCGGLHCKYYYINAKILKLTKIQHQSVPACLDHR